MKVWKKEFSPCEGELAALRRGEEWDPVSITFTSSDKWRSEKWDLVSLIALLLPIESEQVKVEKVNIETEK